MMVLTKALIQKSEENAVKNGGFSFSSLMHAAGKAAADIINQNFNASGKRVLVACGNGNNGGDGFVAAARLKELGAEVDIILPMGKPRTENAAYYYSKLCGVSEVSEAENRYDIVIDAIFGIGLNRAVTGEIGEFIERLNSLDALRAAIDIPSGVLCDSGYADGAVFCADLTVTFIALKPCFLLPDGSDYCGKTAVADIGVKPAGYEYLIIEKPEFKRRKHNSHKGTFGTALLICGSYGMAGAAVLAARGALRGGAGIVKSVICRDIYQGFTSAVPEAVCIPVKTSESGSPDYTDEKIYAALSSASAVLIGCGLGDTADTAMILEKLLNIYTKPIIIDADGINALAKNINILRETKAPVIITPHPGEMARLCRVSVSQIERDRVGFARKIAADYGCVTVLKGANTIVADKDGGVYFNTTGNPGMSKGGSGDVLAGITVSLVCQGFPPLEAAKAAVYLHGEAGDRAAEKHSERSMLASDLIEEL